MLVEEMRRTSSQGPAVLRFGNLHIIGSKESEERHQKEEAHCFDFTLQ